MIKKELLFFFLLFTFTVNSQSVLWKEVSKSNLKSKSKQVKPSKYKVYKLDLQLLKEELKKAPEQRENIDISTVVISFPNKNGELKEYKVSEASVMDVKLQKNHPRIKSYIGKSVDNSNSIIRFSISPYTGFNGIVLNSSTPPTLIEREGNYYQVFSEKDFPTEENPFECGVVDQIEFENKNNPRKKKTLIGGKLRTYRLAMATTGEYSQHILSSLNIQSSASDTEKKNAVLGYLNSIMTSVNAVFERDLAVRMQLVSNNKDIIFLDGATDNLDNSPTESLLGKNQTVCDNIIGSSNYDIGHLLIKIITPEGATGIIVSGRATIASICTNNKARGVSGDTSIRRYDILLHEIGHQFGAKHTFFEAIPPNKEGVEVGQGRTIMSYGRGSERLFFHSVSIEKMTNVIQSRTNCASITNTGNTPPTANAGNNFTVPKLTPFLLEGMASDPDNSILKYTWEQIDSEEGNFPLLSVAPQGPVFSWKLPSTELKRYIPNIGTILNGEIKNTREALPSVSRDVNFAFFVRDNDIRGGETASDKMIVTVDGNSGPFLITSDNRNPSNWYSGRTKTVSWDVANTDGVEVNTPTVDILFSIDGGMTYPTTLATNVANDGSHSFQIPFGIATTEGRFMIKAIDNIFLDINNADITVEQKEFLVNIDDTEKEKSLCLASLNSISYDFTYSSYLGFNDAATFSASNLNGASISFLPASTNTDGATITMTITNISSTNIGSNTISITATSGSISFTNQITLNIYDNSSLNTVSLISPSDGATNVLVPFTFRWNAENNANSYRIEISTDNGFSNIVEDAVVTNNYFVPALLNYNTTYYWRVKAVNTCVSGLFSNIFSFTTPQSVHANDTYIPDDVFEQIFIDSGLDTGALDDYVPTRAVKTIQRLNVPSLNIKDLTGIEDFTALTSLDCSGNKLTSLNVSKNKMLAYLNCSDNSLSALDVSKNTNLTGLYFSGSITTLDLSKNTALTNLRFVFTNLTELDLSKNTALTNLRFVFTNLTELDLSKNTALTNLRVVLTNLTELDLSKNTALTDLRFVLTGLIELDLSKNTELTTLLARFNSSLTSLNLKNKNNTILTNFTSFRNDKLRCIQVDNMAYSVANWIRVDNTTAFREDCTAISVMTNPATLVTPTSATLNGDITSGGGNTVTERGFIYSLLNTNPEIGGANVFPKVTSGAGTGAFSENITGLTENTIYYYTAYATSSAGITTYGNVQTFTTPATTDIPDPNFEQILITLGYDSGNIDGKVLTANISGITFLDLSKNSNTPNSDKIISLSGIEDFTALTRLYCSYNQLTTLDISTNTALTRLYCDSNQLVSLDVSVNTALTSLECFNNQLTTLDVSTNTDLTSLECFNNQLTTLDVSTNTDLITLRCNNNLLTTLNVSANKVLMELYCYLNSLTSLNVSTNTALTVLHCQRNKLTTLNAANGNNNNFTLTYGDNRVASSFRTTGNENLMCIQVDDVAYSTANWPNKDVTSTYSADCFSILIMTNSVSVSSITPTSATLNGDIISDGGNTVTERGFIYSFLNTNPEIGGTNVFPKVTSGRGTGAFSENITSLIPSTIYYFKAYAINSIVATTYGNTQTFTTSNALGGEDFKTAHLSVSPNPTTNILYIKNTNNIKVERVKIFNILGKLIYDKKNKNNQIDFSSFSKAVYILKLIDQNGRVGIKKIIKN